MLDKLVPLGLIFTSLFASPTPSLTAGQSGEIRVEKRVLASERMDLGTRYPNFSVNEGFKFNILLAVSFLEHPVSLKGDAFEKVILNPGEVFAFHKNIMPEFKKYTIITQSSGFITKDGYKTISGLAGNGVCHLATLMNKVSTDAGLEVTAPTNHNFAQIFGIDQKYGTSIYFLPNGGEVSEKQNLYIGNTLDYPVEFKFEVESEILKFTITSI